MEGPVGCWEEDRMWRALTLFRDCIITCNWYWVSCPTDLILRGHQQNSQTALLLLLRIWEVDMYALHMSQPEIIIVCRLLHFLKISTQSGEDQEVAKLHKYTTTKESHGFYNIDDSEPSQIHLDVAISTPPPLSFYFSGWQGTTKVRLLDVRSSNLAEIPS